MGSDNGMRETQKQNRSNVFSIIYLNKSDEKSAGSMNASKTFHLKSVEFLGDENLNPAKHVFKRYGFHHITSCII